MTGEPVVIVSGSVREALFAQPLVAALEGAWVFAPRESLPVFRAHTVGRGFTVSPGFGWLSAWQRLRAIATGLAVLPPPASASSAGLAYLSGIPTRVAIAGGGQWWATDRLPLPADLHPVDAVRRLASFVRPGQPEPPGPRVEPSAATRERIAGRLESAGVRAGDVVLLAIPGLGNWVRQRQRPLWPPERFAVLVNQLQPDLVVLVRGMGDRRVVREVRGGLPRRTAVIDLPGFTPDELAAIAERSVGVVGHDGDALHVAAAAGARAVALLGPGDLRPYGREVTAIQVDDLQAVPARQILEVARHHLGVPTHA